MARDPSLGIRRTGRRVPAGVRDERAPDQATAYLGFVALGCAMLIGVAVVLEVIGGAAANSAVPAWAKYVVPLAWAQPLRVLWWLLVAGAAFGFRIALHRLGFRQRRVVVAASVVPFLVFATGIAFSADWATWH